MADRAALLAGGVLLSALACSSEAPRDIVEPSAAARADSPATPPARAPTQLPQFDFLSTPGPELVLTKLAEFTPEDLPDLSLGTPTPHPILAPSDIEFFPNDSGDALLVLSTGLIVWLDRNMSVVSSFPVPSSSSLSKLGPGDTFRDNEGVLGLTFHPDFAENGYFYLHIVSEPRGGVDIWRLRWKPHLVDSLWDSAKLIFRNDKPQIATNPDFLFNHNGGNPSFGPDGKLYVAMGDGAIGGGLPWSENQSPKLNSFWGKLVRIDPEGIDAPEIVAKGLRNPFTHTWRGDEVFWGDVGATDGDHWEEINRIVVDPATPSTVPDYGWPAAPGPCWDASLAWTGVPLDCSQYVEPLHGYRKDDSTYLDEDPETGVPAPGTVNRSAIILGPAYSGGAYDGYFDDVVLYGDLIQGWIRGILFNEEGTPIADRHVVHHGKWITGFTIGPDDKIYMLGGFVESSAIFRIDVVEPPAE